jgi:hypothetical protein
MVHGAVETLRGQRVIGGDYSIITHNVVAKANDDQTWNGAIGHTDILHYGAV